MDFGLAKVVREEPDLRKLTRSGVVLGTPAYLSPEQATAGAVDGRSDLFALGAVLYECDSGLAARAANRSARLVAHLT